MARPLRIQFPGAVYHVTSRGNARQDIFPSRDDRRSFLSTLASVTNRYQWRCYAWCLMDNHYHLIVETLEATLASGMRQLNGVYTQFFNRRYGRTGHLLQGRYKAVLVDSERYLLEAVRYTLLNPVRAGIVKVAGQWPWSSYRSIIGRAPTEDWLAADSLLARFSKDRESARKQFIRFVQDGVRQPAIWEQLRAQLYLGDAQFVESMQRKVEECGDLSEIPRIQREPPPLDISDFRLRHPRREDGVVHAYATGAYTMKQIADCFGIHYTTVSRIVRRHADRMHECKT